MTLPNYVTIGRGTYFAELLHGRYADNERIEIGNYVSIAQGVRMIAGGGHRRDCVSTYPFDVLHGGEKTGSLLDRCYEPGPGIKIGNDVHLGFGATIIGHVTIGDGAVIGANATVFTDIPAYGIAVGNPARVNKFRFSPDVVEALLRIKWWNWDEEPLRLRRDHFYWPIAKFCAEYDGQFCKAFPYLEEESKCA